MSKTPHFSFFKCCGGIVFSCLQFFASTSAYAEEQFKDVEIRVIRNKFFQKTRRLELGVSGGAVMNQSFFYTYLGSANLGFHFSESIGVAAEAGYGMTRNKSDCTELGENFGIDPIATPISYFYGGTLLYTPIYGKYQLGSGNVVYFDTFISAGGGLGGVLQRDFPCSPPKQGYENNTTILSVPQVNFGIGQRFFLNKNIAAIWHLRMLYVPSDPGVALFREAPSIKIGLGMGYFL